MNEEIIKKLRRSYEALVTEENKTINECLDEIERLREVVTEIQDFLAEEGFFNRSKELAKDLDSE